MSENKTNVNRRLARRSYHKDERAVSPVVATLLLILIAVAAAAALYLWVTSFQSSTQKNIGSPGTQATLVIGGSTTVYPLDVAAVTWFEQNNSNVAITNNQGGSGAGLVALCSGAVDIAPASEYITQAADIPQTCLNQAVATRIGTSAVSVLTGNLGANDLQAVNTIELDCLYEINGGGTYSAGSGLCPSDTAGGLAAPSATCTAPITGVTGECYTWDDLPVNGTLATTSPYAANAGCVWVGTPLAPGPGCDAAASAKPIQVYSRADNSGTAEGFIDQILQTSCSSNIITNCASMQYVTTETGETALTAAIEANVYGFGYVSTGYAATTEGGGISAKNTPGLASQTPAVQTCGSYQTDQGSSQTTCTLQAEPLEAVTAYIEAGSYQAWRPLDFYTLGAPAGESAAFINFVEQPYVNAQLCALEYFVPYTSGTPSAAGQH